jgi:CheY-like chemotaxis protein
MINDTTIRLLLADDDEDDCLLFAEALQEIQISTQLSMVQNGEQLLRVLQVQEANLPHILFLDLNMPRINGLQCLTELKSRLPLKRIRVVIFSTSYQEEIADQLFENGAIHYLQKPRDFQHLKLLITQVLVLNANAVIAGNSSGKRNDRKQNYRLTIKQNQV